MQAMETMDYSFIALQFLLFNVSKGFLIYHSNGVMEGRIQAMSRHMEGQDLGSLDLSKGKSKIVWLYAHIPMYVGLREISTYIWEKGIKVTYNK